MWIKLNQYQRKITVGDFLIKYPLDGNEEDAIPLKTAIFQRYIATEVQADIELTPVELEQYYYVLQYQLKSLINKNELESGLWWIEV